MTMDRSAYFPGEDATLTIHIKNPTASAREIPQPFVYGTGYVMPQKRDDKAELWGGWVDLGPREEMDIGRPNTPTQFIAPGQTIHKQWLLSDSSRDPVVGKASRLPYQAGEYRLHYSYPGGATANFQVVYPTLEDWRMVPLQKRWEEHFVDPDGKERRPAQMVRRNVAIFILEYQGQHVLVVRRAEHVKGHDGLKAGALWDRLGWGFGPYYRLVETSSPIRFVSATGDAAENVVITYADDAGQSHTIKLDANREIVH
jgi:hypothetical protein